MALRMNRVGRNLLLGAIALLTGCARIGPPLPPSLELPKPVADLRAVRKGDRVHLSWTVPSRTTDGETLQHPGRVLICRTTLAEMTACGTPVGQLAGSVPAAGETGKQVDSAQKAEFTDTLSGTSAVEGTGQFTYSVEVLNSYGRSGGLSNKARVPAAAAVKPPSAFGAQLTPSGVSLTWSCAPAPSPQPGVSYQLRIHRRASDAQSAALVAEADPRSCGSPVLDTTMEWEKTYFYYAEVETIVSQGHAELQFEGDDTQEVKVVTHDVFPPAVPSGLQAVFSGEGQSPFIDLSWKPNTDADLAGYNIYRHEAGAPATKLNAAPAKVAAFRDDRVQPGRTYFYSVSALDLRGNESGQSEETSEQVPD